MISSNEYGLIHLVGEKNPNQSLQKYIYNDWKQKLLPLISRVELGGQILIKNILYVLTKYNAIRLGRGLPNKADWGGSDFREQDTHWRSWDCEEQTKI